MYNNQSLQVRWGSHTSTRFNVQNGVKQGGVLSPILLTFNGSKSHFMVFRGQDCQEVTICEILINNIPLNNANKAVDLGHTLSTEKKRSLVSAAIAQFWSSFNLFRADFGHIHPYVQCKLFQHYCCSFYGAPLWLLSSHGVRCSYCMEESSKKNISRVS